MELMDEEWLLVVHKDKKTKHYQSVVSFQDH